jgi:hypothetical protein
MGLYDNLDISKECQESGKLESLLKGGEAERTDLNNKESSDCEKRRIEWRVLRLILITFKWVHEIFQQQQQNPIPIPIHHIN